MAETSRRKTYKYKLKPTPEQERDIERVLGVCCQLYNIALEHRKTAYERCGVSISRYMQEAELKDIRSRRSRSMRVSTRRSCKTCWRGWTRAYPGLLPPYPRSGRDAGLSALPGRAPATTPSPTKQFSNGATLTTMASWSSSKIGRMRRALVPPLGGHAQDGHDQPRSGWLVCLFLVCRRADAAACRPPDSETGIDVGLKVVR